MPTERVTLELYTDFTAAGGTRLGNLGNAESGAVRYAVAGDGKMSVAVARTRWTALAGDVRQVLRITWPEGTVDEGRIARVGETADQTLVQITALPAFDELASGGPIIRVVGGQAATRLAGELPLATWLSNYIVTHPSAIRLGLVVGTLARNPTLPGDFDAGTPAQVIRTLFAAAGLEVEMVRTTDTTWTLAGPLAIGSAVTPLTIRPGVNQLDLAATVDDQALATVVVPLGDADPDTGDRATMANARFDVTALPGASWVTIRDPETSTSPLVVDKQWVGAALQVSDLSTRTILDSRISDGSVQVSSTIGVTVGARVGLATVTGNPLVEVFDSVAVAARGRRVFPKSWSGLRGEANEILNGRFASALTGWTAANVVTPPAFAELTRAELNRTVVFAVNGARAAATGIGTPFAVDGLAAGARVVRGDVMIQSGGEVFLSATAVPNTSGGLTLSLATGLPVSFVDNDPVTLVRREVATMATVTAMPKLSGMMVVSNADTALVQRLLYLAKYDNPLAPNGDVDILGPGGEDFNNNVAQVYAWPGEPTRMVIRYGGFGGSAAASTNTSNITSYSVQSAQRLRFNYTTGSPTVGHTVRAEFSSANATQGYIPPWCSTPSIGFLFIGTIITVTGSYIDVDWLGVPSTADLTGLVANLSFFSNNVQSFLCYNENWSGNFALTWTRERRTMRCSGAHSVAATSITFKNQTPLQRRDWTSADTLHVERPAQHMKVRMTAINFTGRTFTIDLANSTAQDFVALWTTVTFQLSGSLFDIDTSDYEPFAIITLVSIVGTTVTWASVYPFDADAASNTATLPQTIQVTAPPGVTTYAVTGSASWGSGGTVSVPVSVPSGRTVPMGARCYANWIGTNITNGYMVVTAAVTGAASALVLRGGDAYPNIWDGTTSFDTSVYLLTTSAYLEILGNTLIAGATATANGSGQANVTLVAPNTNAVPDNAVLTLVRPPLLRTTDPTTGSVARLVYPTNAANSPSTPGLASSTARVSVPSGSTRTVTAFVTFALSAGTYPSGQLPAVSIIDEFGTILATAYLAATTVTVIQTPTIARIIVQATLTTTKAVGLRVYGGTTDPALWTVVLEAMLAATARDDVPFISSSWANQLAQRGADTLALQRIPVAAVTIDVAVLRRWSDAPATTAPIALGQPVVVPSLGITRRVLVYERSVTDPQRGRVEVGTVPTDLSRRVATYTGGQG